MKDVSSKIKYVGVTDREIDLFEGQYRVPDGITYNSYIIIDEKITVMDSVDARFADEWISNIRGTIGTRTPDYLVIQHMEPDHSGSILAFLEAFPTAQLVSSDKAFGMMAAFFGRELDGVRIKGGDELPLGEHTLRFIAAPMVHWPEVVVSLELCEGVLFSADAFGKFGKGELGEAWRDEARRYYIGIVGKYGLPVRKLLSALSGADVRAIAPLHGPILTENIGYYVSLYSKWSGYEPEEGGVTIAYASIYGGTAAAARELYDELTKRGHKAAIFDLARCDHHEAVASAFRYDTLVLASATYNGTVFPPMREYILALCDRGFTSRRLALIENGSWAPSAAKAMRELLSAAKDISYIAEDIRILSAKNNKTSTELTALAEALSK